jgi:hypothetical protein
MLAIEPSREKVTVHVDSENRDAMNQLIVPAVCVWQDLTATQKVPNGFFF